MKTGKLGHTKRRRIEEQLQKVAIQQAKNQRWGIHHGKIVTLHEGVTHEGEYYPKGVMFEHLRGEFKGKWTCLLFNASKGFYEKFAPKYAMGVDSKNGVFNSQLEAMLAFNKHLDGEV